MELTIIKITAVLIGVLLGKIWWTSRENRKLENDKRKADAFIHTQEITKHNEKTPLTNLIHEFDDELDSDRKRDS